MTLEKKLSGKTIWKTKKIIGSNAESHSMKIIILENDSNSNN
jgi:hypothetical protein